MSTTQIEVTEEELELIKSNRQDRCRQAIALLLSIPLKDKEWIHPITSAETTTLTLRSDLLRGIESLMRAI